MAHRFFLASALPSDPGQPLALTESDVHHAVRVLRVRPGEDIEFVEPGGPAKTARVVSADDGGVVVTDVRDAAGAECQTPSITLFQGVAKGEKMDSIVRQAVEVGAARIVPVITARTIVRLDAAKKQARRERWQRIARSAAEQAKRSIVPEVAVPLALREALDLLGAFDRVVVLWEEHSGTTIAEALSGAETGEHIALVVGPEGGLAAEEVDSLVARGAVLASLGPTVMRTETAAVVSVALAVAALGGMGGVR